jgi:hypothetical protein
MVWFSTAWHGGECVMETAGSAQMGVHGGHYCQLNSAPFMFHMCHSMLQTLGCFNNIYTLRFFLLAYIEYKFAAVIIRMKIGQVFVRVTYYQRVGDDVCNKMTEGG